MREESWDPLMFDDPEVLRAGVVSDSDHSSRGPNPMLANLLHLAATPGVVCPRSPTIGEHSTAILEDAGVSPNTIEHWRADGVVVQGGDVPMGRVTR